MFKSLTASVLGLLVLATPVLAGPVETASVTDAVVTGSKELCGAIADGAGAYRWTKYYLDGIINSSGSDSDRHLASEIILAANIYAATDTCPQHAEHISQSMGELNTFYTHERDLKYGDSSITEI